MHTQPSQQLCNNSPASMTHHEQLCRQWQCSRPPTCSCSSVIGSSDFHFGRFQVLTATPTSAASSDSGLQQLAPILQQVAAAAAAGCGPLAPVLQAQRHSDVPIVRYQPCLLTVASSSASNGADGPRRSSLGGAMAPGLDLPCSPNFTEAMRTAPGTGTGWEARSERGGLCRVVGEGWPVWSTLQSSALLSRRAWGMPGSRSPVCIGLAPLAVACSPQSAVSALFPFP